MPFNWISRRDLSLHADLWLNLKSFKGLILVNDSCANTMYHQQTFALFQDECTHAKLAAQELVCCSNRAVSAIYGQCNRSAPNMREKSAEDTSSILKKKPKRSSEQRYLFQQTQAKGILLSLPIRGATRQKIKCRPQTRPLLSFPVISSFGTESQFFHWFKKKKQQCWEQQALALLAFTYQLLHYTLSQILTQLQKTKELLHLDTLELHGSTCFMYFQSAPSALCINISLLWPHLYSNLLLCNLLTQAIFLLIFS